MPIYAYPCEECQEPFELFVRSVNAPVELECPKCGSSHIEKDVTAFSALRSGTGASVASSASCAPSG